MPNFAIGDVVRRIGHDWAELRVDDLGIVSNTRIHPLSNEMEIMVNTGGSHWYAHDSFVREVMNPQPIQVPLLSAETPVVFHNTTWTTADWSNATIAVDTVQEAALEPQDGVLCVGDYVRIINNTANGPNQYRNTIQQIDEIARNDVGLVKYYFRHTRGLGGATWYQYREDLEYAVVAEKQKQNPVSKDFRSFLKSKAVVS